MKGFDPALIKWIFFGLMFVIRAVAATNRKNKKKDNSLRPPQSAPPPPPIASPTMNQNQSAPPPAPPTMNQNQPMPRDLGTKPSKKSDSDSGSPWSSSKGPFDS